MKEVGLAHFSGVTVLTMAHVFGDWAAHLAKVIAPEINGWRVTHVPTGRCLRTLADELTESDAVIVAQALADRCPPIHIHNPDYYDRRDDELRFIIEAIVGEVIS